MNPRLQIGLVVGLAVVLVAVAVVLSQRGDEEADQAREAAASIEGLQTFSDLPRDHVDGTVDYAQTPPVGGDHFRVWLKCGVYDAPIANEVAVHDLEHGVIWITYDPDAVTGDEITTLEAALPEQGIMSPYPGLDSPVVLNAWERQLAVDSVDDPRIQQFVDAFESGPQAPERTVGCSGGATLEQLAELGAPSAPAA